MGGSPSIISRHVHRFEKGNLFGLLCLKVFEGHISFRFPRYLWTLRVSLNIDIQCKTANEINMWTNGREKGEGEENNLR